MIEMGGIDMGQMVLEQAQMVVQAEEIDMAADVMTFVDDLLPQLQSNTGFCDEEFAAKAAAAPAEGAPGLPLRVSVEGAPAEGAPAEGAPAEAPPPPPLRVLPLRVANSPPYISLTKMPPDA